MRHSLDNLPDEILDLICQESRQRPLARNPETGKIYVPLTGLQPDKSVQRNLFYYTSTTRLPVPTTAITLCLVSRRFRRIATPYVWETLDLVITHSRGTTLPSFNGLDWNTAPRSRRCFEIVGFIADNPHIGALVRVLRFDMTPLVEARISSRVFGSHSVGRPGPHMTSSMALIEKFFSSMSALHAVHVADFVIISAAAIRSVLLQPTVRLFSYSDSFIGTDNAQDRRRTSFCGFDLSHLDAVFSYGHVGEYSLLQYAPCLKYVVVEPSFFVDSAEMKSLPWIRTVIELNIRDTHHLISRKISEEYKKACRDTNAGQLRQLNISFDEVTRPALQQVLCNFASKSLRLVILSYIPPLKPAELAEILQAMPSITDLVLAANNVAYEFPWDASSMPEEYAVALGNAKRLRCLEWNNSVSPSNRECWLSTASQHCPALEVVIVHYRSLFLSSKYTIVRKPNNTYESCVFTQDKYAERVTSSWDITTTPYLL